MYKSLIVFGLLSIATTFANFELPIVFDIGAFDGQSPRINHEVQAAGPFVTERNVTFNFQWSSTDHIITGVRMRGSEPRYDRVSVTVHRLERHSFSIDVTVINTSFVLFWAEPHGIENPILPIDNLQTKAEN